MLELAGEFEMVFYDQRGGGRSKTDGTDTITWQTHVDDLAHVASELMTGPLIVVGYSWGALLAMLYATRPPAPVPGTPSPAALILISPAALSREHRRRFESTFTERQQSDAVRSEHAALVASGLRERDPEAYRRRSFELSVAGYFADPDRVHDLTAFRVMSRVQQSVWDSLDGVDLRPALREIRVPTLVVHGRQDPIPLESSEEVASALGARLVVLDDCGHVPYVERPAPLFAAVRTFLHERKTEPASLDAE